MATTEAAAMEREALKAAMDGFLAALAARDPALARLAPGVRYTENGQRLPVGDGAWATVTALGGYRHGFIDAVSGSVGGFATIVEGRTRSILVFRLAVTERGISAIEAVVARPGLGAVGPFADGPVRLDEAGTPARAWFAPVPEAERMDRASLRRIADAYFAGLERNDGKGWYPFADDCIRIENGFQTTLVPDAVGGDTPYQDAFRALSARQQFETGFFAFVDHIRDRRFPVIDEEHGLVFSLAFFDHSGTVRDYPLADGRIVTSGIDRPFSWQIGEAFRIERGLITRIEAVMTACPYGMPSGWD